MDTQPIRPDEELDWTQLAVWLRAQPGMHAVPGLDLSCDMEVRQFRGGHSNLTYLLRFGDPSDGGTELVLRRAPFGPLPPAAHDMVREHRWLAALPDWFPLAPRSYACCDDASVIGAPFHIMERRHGVVIRRDEPAALDGDDGMRARVSAAVIDTLASLHAVDVSAAPLAALGKPAGFVARQVRGWTERWQRARTSDVPEMDAVAAWLLAHLPADADRPSIVHGDFKLDNLLLDAADLSRPVAVLDWEMTALGDPLVDLGILLTYWTRSDGDDALASVTRHRGWFRREGIIDRYSVRSGRDVSGIRFYETFALFKVAVVIQQIYARYVRGQTGDLRFAHFDVRVEALARQAMAGVG